MIPLLMVTAACDPNDGPRDVGPLDREHAIEGDPMCLLQDLDGDFRVDTSDLVEVAALGFDTPCAECRADLDGDGVIGTGDLVEFLAAGGLGPDGEGRVCENRWAFYDETSIGQRRALTPAEAAEQYDVELDPDGLFGGLDRAVLHEDGVLEVPPGFWERVEDYASSWGEEGDDYDARYVEALIQYGAIDPDYPPHAELVSFYLAHVNDEPPDATFRSTGFCRAFCGISVSWLRQVPVRSEANVCDQAGSITTEGGELAGHCEDVDLGGLVRGRFDCTKHYVVVPYCIFEEVVPGGCSTDAIGDEQCMLEASFSAQGKIRADAERDGSEEYNIARAGARLKVAVQSQAPGSTSHTWEAPEFIVTASAFDVTFWDQLGLGAQALFGVFHSLFMNCEFTQGGVACTGQAVADALAKGAAIIDKTESRAAGHATGELEAHANTILEQAQFPNFNEDLAIPTPLPHPPDDERARVRVQRLTAHRFEGRVEMESWLEARAVAEAGGSAAKAESWGAATYEVKGIKSSFPDDDFTCHLLPRHATGLPGTQRNHRWDWQCSGKPRVAEGADEVPLPAWWPTNAE